MNIEKAALMNEALKRIRFCHRELERLTKRAEKLRQEEATAEKMIRQLLD